MLAFAGASRVSSRLYWPPGDAASAEGLAPVLLLQLLLLQRLRLFKLMLLVQLLWHP